MNHILVVDDQKSIVDLVIMNLKMSNYSCDYALDGEEAIKKIDTHTYDLILLDVMLPKINGFEIMEYIHYLNIPVIFLTAKASVNDRVAGLKLGAEDYLVKPFEIIELLARIETVLRRFNKIEHTFKLYDIEADMISHMVKKNGVKVNLTTKEYEILLLFLQNPNIALYRETIYERIWAGTYMGDSRTVDLHVQRMRKKIDWEDKIVAVYKIGYRLEV